MKSLDSHTTPPKIVHANPAIGERGDLHLYVPDEKRPHPFVLGIHGGGWNSGDQEAFSWLWPKVRPLGVGLVLASYRLAPSFPFPQAYEDLLGALAWLKGNCAFHQLDPMKCMLFGGSAGGHLAMLLAARATSGTMPRPAILGVATICGIMDLASQHAWETGRSKHMTWNFLQSNPHENPGLFRDASPLSHVHAAMPPVWMAHGSADNVVPVDQSRNMVEKLREFGHSPIYLEARGIGHKLLETTNSGKAVQPGQILFEQDFLRFVQRCLGL